MADKARARHLQLHAVIVAVDWVVLIIEVVVGLTHPLPEAAVLDQRGGAVVIEGGNAEDARGAGPIRIWCR